MNERAIFTAALDRDTPADRAAYLDTACAGDPALRARVEALLRSHEAAGDFPGKLAPHRLAEEFAARGSDDTRTGPSGPDFDGPLDFLEPSDRPGSIGRLGHYEVQEVVGRGGMGLVFRAFDEQLHRVVAIKVMAPQLATSAAARKRFGREARAAAAVTHDHVVTIHAVEESGPLPRIVMQFVAGASLQDRLDRTGPLPLLEVLRIGMQTATGLAAAHAQGIVHRDVKPANILLENGVERVKLTDFGLARAADDASLTQSGVIAGTPSFMSPEQAEGRPVDYRSDLFSLGSVLYAMCTGRPPFRAGTSMGVLRRVCEETPTPIRQVNPDVPDWLAAVVERLHAKDPAARFQTATEVAELLGRQLAHVQHPSVVPLPEVVRPPHPSPTPARRARRRWAIAAALLAVLGTAEATGVSNVRATVTRILTPDGTLVVETDEPGVKITVTGDGGLVMNRAGLEEIRLRPGSYRVAADRDGLAVPLDRELVTVSPGGREVVKVRVEAADTRLPWAEEFAPLFNGKDLTGWATASGGTGMWRLEGGAITCTGPMDHLLTRRNDFGDFHLRAEVKINAGGNSGIYFRAGKPLAEIGDYEAQITNDPDQPYQTGSLYNLVRVPDAPVPPETWFTLEIIAVGKRIRVLVNGKEMVDFTENRPGRKTRGGVALQHLNPATRVFFRKVEIKELRAATSVAEEAFVLLGGAGIAERKFDLLAEAVRAAADGDTIEVRGNGPFASDPVTISNKRALTIRAGTGFRPVLRLKPGAVERHHHLLSTNGPLSLQGLEIQTDHLADTSGTVPEGYVAIAAQGGHLHVANCRFFVHSRQTLYVLASVRAVVKNCEFFGGDVWSEALAGSHASGGVWELENNVLVGGAVTDCGSQTSDVKDTTVRIRRCSAVRCTPARICFWTTPKDAGTGLIARLVQFEASESLLDDGPWMSAVHFPEFLDPSNPLHAATGEEVIHRLVCWRGSDNVRHRLGRGAPDPDAAMIWCGTVTSGKPLSGPVSGVNDLATWAKFWDSPETGSVEGEIRYKGGDLVARLAGGADKLTPEDFRLRPGSAGYRAGKDGKDLGADVDLVGPGPAYERWKRTPEYPQWLKETGQKK